MLISATISLIFYPFFTHKVGTDMEKWLGQNGRQKCDARFQIWIFFKKVHFYILIIVVILLNVTESLNKLVSVENRNPDFEINKQ